MYAGVARLHAQVGGGRFNCLEPGGLLHSIFLLSNRRAEAEHVSLAHVAAGSIGFRGARCPGRKGRIKKDQVLAKPLKMSRMISLD